MVYYWCQGEGTLSRVGQLSGVANCWQRSVLIPNKSARNFLENNFKEPLDKPLKMCYNDGTNKEEVTPMKEHLIRFLDNCLELAKATTATRSLVHMYKTQAYGALAFYCEACYYENNAQEEEALTNLWDDYYRTEFFNAWLEKTE